MDRSTENGAVLQLDLISLIKDVFRDWWVILLAAVSASLISYVAVNELYTPEYTTSSTFVVTSRDRNTNIYQNLTYAQDMTEQFSYILESNVLQKKVMEDVGLDAFTAKTSAEIVPETNLMALKVTADTAMESYHILQSIMENYDQVSDYVMDDMILEVIQSPTVPMAPSNPLQDRKIMKLAFLIGGLGMAGVIGLFSFFRDTVKNEREAKQKIDARFFGSIWHERKRLKRRRNKGLKRISMRITNPLLSFRFVEANKMAASRIRSRMDREGAKVLLVTSVAENEGKSTVAANLALALSQQDKKVLLMDSDFRRPAQHKVFDMDLEKENIQNLSSVLREGEGAEKLVQNPGGTRLFAVFNTESVANLEELKEFHRLDIILQFFREQMDYIILDTSPMALVADTEEIAQLADASLLVIRKDRVLARDVNDAVDTLNETRAKVLGCVLNDAETLLSGSAGYGKYRYGQGGYYGKYEG